MFVLCCEFDKFCVLFFLINCGCDAVARHTPLGFCVIEHKLFLITLILISADCFEVVSN